MSLKSAIQLTLAIAILFAALGAISLPGPSLSIPIAYEQGARIQPGIMVSRPVLACAGCSGNGGGPG